MEGTRCAEWPVYASTRIDTKSGDVGYQQR
ncbi:hypothetical protein F4553_003888 [Allocatelliglobosispora scoriae]|uniref:Uncharacterized protein n=1 Tax=Allocatelliglobosispora scoriae TaxID=643052 RepID=A0A841BTM0_9ACTN|nr:hypothetical protein [Allocatelliglobosispora scoriae]